MNIIFIFKHQSIHYHMHIKPVLASVLGLFFSSLVFAQSAVNVNPLSGSANISIPIYTISSGQVSLPITLTYNSGVKVLDVEGTAGMGWQLNAGGQVSRQVHGLPDDVTKDIGGNSRIGWMSSANTAANAINGFTIQNDGGTTCAKETSDINYINTNFPFNYDTEPDMFYVGAPGLSCQLIYNRATAKFVPVALEDLVVTFTTDPISGLVTSFTIINDKGIKYVFAAFEMVKQTVTDATPSYFTTQYKQYQNGINYNDAWFLSSMTDAIGNALLLTYENGNTRNSVNPLSLYLPGSTEPTSQYKMQQSVTRPLLNSIKTNNINDLNKQLSFIWVPNSSTRQLCVRQVSGMGRSFQFTYNDVYSPGEQSYKRFFLRSFFDYGCASPSSYQFAYGGETSTSGNMTTLLPDSAAIKVDYWGYAAFNSNTSRQPKVWINPANSAYQRYAIYYPGTGGGSYIYSTTNGNNRSAELTNFNAGNLTGITYLGGGTTTLTYEPNTYLDVPSNTVVSGGGIRVKQITDYDGIDATKNIIRDYTYTDPATGITSGKPASLPVFAFTIPYSGTATGASLWNNNTMLSDYDLSDEDHSILYSHFKVSQTGAGSTLYQYYLPATNWDNSAVPGCSGCTTADWAPTINYTARNNCNSAYGPIKNDIYSYPFIPNPNYDFEKGLLQKVTNFNDAGAEVSETGYTYQRSFTPSVITAFKYEDNPNGTLFVKAYNKYKIYYNTSELTSTVTKKVFDSPSLTQVQSSTTNYIYGSSQHKLLTQQSATNSDNSTVITNTKYIKDYTAAAGPNANVNAIYYLQQQHINAPVETWQQVTRSGVTKTTSAGLTLFKGFALGSTTLYLPSQQLRLIQPDGTTGFTPYAINGQVAISDPQYITVANYSGYDNNGYLQTADDGNKSVKTMITDHATGNPVASFNNAAYGEIAFSDYDTDQALTQDCSFTISGSQAFTATGSHTGNAYGLGTSQTVTKTISVRNPKVSNYIFSIWINAATAGNLNFTLSGGTTATATKAYTAGDWAYYQWKLPVNNASSAFTISITSSQAISVDDILFYPDIAMVNTAGYDSKTGYLVTETNTNGVSAYYQKDQWGRLLFQYDQDRNIVKKRSYFTAEDLSLGLVTPSINSGTITLLVPATFTAYSSPCALGVTYTWNFGDGTPPLTALSGNIQSHTYNAAGSYTISVTASHATLGTKSSTQTITVKLPPLVPHVCLSGVEEWNTCDNSAETVVTCGTNPSSRTRTYFTVTSVDGSGYGDLSYQWQIKYIDGTSWTNVGTGLQDSKSCGRTSKSYVVRCIVTSTSGQTAATSETLEFTANSCNP